MNKEHIKSIEVYCRNEYHRNEFQRKISFNVRKKCPTFDETFWSLMDEISLECREKHK